MYSGFLIPDPNSVSAPYPVSGMYQQQQPVPVPMGQYHQQQQQQYAMAMQAQMHMMQHQQQQSHAIAGVAVGDQLQASTIHGNDDVDDPKGRMPVHGNEGNYNINSLLHQNIMESDYFKALYQLRTYHEVIDEVYKRVPHVGPWQTGTSRIPSTAFCLLTKFLVMRLTYNQVRGLLNTNDCPFVRALGLLYLRYICPPKDLWKWYDEFLEDEEEFTPSSDPDLKMTVGAFCIKLLTDMQYFGTTLPRIPVPIERKIKVLLLLLSEKQKRRRGNLKAQEQGLFCKGAKVRAIYSDEENEPAWYDAVIEYKDEDSSGCKYWVMFPEYGNQSLVDLGEMELPASEKDKDRERDRDRDRDRDEHRRGGDRRRSRSRDRRRSRSRSRSRSRGRGGKSDGDSEDLLQKVLREERNSSAAVGKDYARRPASYKGSLAMKVDRFTARKRSRSRSPPRSRDDGYRDRTRDRREGREQAPSSFTSSSKAPEMTQAQLENLRKLREKYGDASSSGI